MLAFCVVATSCGKKGNTPDNETESTTRKTDTVAETDTDDSSDDFTVPEKLNYDKDYTILTFNATTDEFGNADGEQGDSVNSALLSRDLFTEEYLGVTLKIETRAGQYSNRLDYVDYVAQSVNANLHAFDLIGSYSMIPVPLMIRGLLYDLNTLNYLDFDKTWWASFIYDSVAINDKAYFMSGDISVNLLYNMQIMTFHGDLLSAYNISEEQLYALVDNDEWTLDRLLEVCADISSPDSNGNWSEQATYGVSCVNGNMIDSFYICSGQKEFEIEDGHLTASSDIKSQKTLELYEKVYRAVHDDHLITYGDNAGANNNIFKENRSVFGVLSVNQLPSIIEDTQDVGILPFPKYDEDDPYRTLLGTPYAQYYIPVDVENSTVSAAGMETLAYAGNLYVTPEVFQKVMKYRFAKDPNSSRMFDIIRAGACTEFGILSYMLFNNGGEPASMFRNALFKKNQNWISYVESNFETQMASVAGSLDDFFFYD